MDLVESCLSGRTSARVIAGEHLDAGKKLLALLGSVAPSTEYAAFCDQDDIWLPGKLSAAVVALQHEQGPALYCSAVELVDRDLVRIGTHRRCVRGPSFENALVENIATGCTIVLNRRAVQLLSSATPRNFLMHDAWCYLVVSGCGKVIYDPRPQVLYRQHALNAIGVARTVRSEWADRPAPVCRRSRTGIDASGGRSQETVWSRTTPGCVTLAGCVPARPRVAASAAEVHVQR